MITCYTNGKKIKLDKEHEEFFRNKRIILTNNILCFKNDKGKKQSLKNYILGFEKTKKNEYVYHLDEDTYNLEKKNLKIGLFGTHSKGGYRTKKAEKINKYAEKETTTSKIKIYCNDEIVKIQRYKKAISNEDGFIITNDIYFSEKEAKFIYSELKKRYDKKCS